MNHTNPMPRPIHFEGYDLDASQVCVVDPVTTHPWGKLSCEWQYGFKVRFPGAEIVLLPPDLDDPKRKDAEDMRRRFIAAVWPALQNP